MVHIGNYLRNYLAANKIRQVDLCRMSGMKKSNVNHILSRATLETDLLEKICASLHLDPSIFFDVPNTAVYDLRRENELLKQLLSDKDRIISLLTARLEAAENETKTGQ